MKSITLLMLAVFSFTVSMAQAPEMADTMRSEGKIYVVVGVLMLIFAVLFTYLIFMDLRLRKLEKNIK